MDTLLAAGDLTVSLVVFLIISFVSWLLSLSRNQNAKEDRPRNRPRPRPQRRPQNAGNVATERVMIETPEGRMAVEVPVERAQRRRQAPPPPRPAPTPPVRQRPRQEAAARRREEVQVIENPEVIDEPELIIDPEVVPPQPRRARVTAAASNAKIAGNIRAALNDPESVRQAIILNEILQRPRILRDRG